MRATVPVGAVAPRQRRLISAAEAGLRRGIAAATPRARRSTRSARRSSTRCSRAGSASARELTGHGIGRRIHEPPTVANVFDPLRERAAHARPRITVEPIIAAGRGDVVAMPDGWTVRTADGSPVAHAEHTIVVTGAEPIVLTTPVG